MIETNKLQLGERVFIPTMNIAGVLRYLGPTQFKEGIWAGIEVDDQSGKNDGSVGGIQYFTCTLPNKGLFIHASRVEPFVGREIVPEPRSLQTAAPSKSNLSGIGKSSRESLAGGSSLSGLRPPAFKSRESLIGVPAETPAKPKVSGSDNATPSSFGVAARANNSISGRPSISTGASALKAPSRPKISPPSPSQNGHSTLIQAAQEAAQRKKSISNTQTNRRSISASSADHSKAVAATSVQTSTDSLSQSTTALQFEKQKAELEVLTLQNNLLAKELSQSKSVMETFQTQVGLLHAQLLDAQGERDELKEQVIWLRGEMAGLLDQMTLLQQQQQNHSPDNQKLARTDDAKSMLTGNEKELAKKVDEFCSETQTDLRSLEADLEACLEAIESESKMKDYCQTESGKITPSFQSKNEKGEVEHLKALITSYEAKIHELSTKGPADYAHVADFIKQQEEKYFKQVEQNEINIAEKNRLLDEQARRVLELESKLKSAEEAKDLEARACVSY